MTVKELKQYLDNQPDDMKVLAIRHYDCALMDAVPRLQKFNPIQNKGEYLRDFEVDDEENCVDGIVIGVKE